MRAISCGPVAQFMPINGTSSASITVAAAEISGPTSIVPVVSTVTCNENRRVRFGFRARDLGCVDRGF